MTTTLQATPPARPLLQSHRLSDVHRNKDLYRCKQPLLYKNKQTNKQPQALDRKQQNNPTEEIVTVQFIKS